MCLMRHLIDFGGEDKVPEFKPIPADNFLAEYNLSWALRFFYKPNLRQRHRIRWWLNNENVLQRYKSQPSNHNINLVDHRGRSALFYACENGHLDAAVYLILCGALGRLKDKETETPFSLAVDGGYEEIALLLYSVNQAMERGDSPKHLSSLHMACSYKLEKIVALLLEHGQDPNDVAFDGWTPVHVAVGENNLRVLKALLDKGGMCDRKKNDGRTPLSIAASKGHVENVRELFRRMPNLDPTPRDKWKRTPLHGAAAGGHIDVFELLHDKQSEVQPDEDGWMPIHFATSGGHFNIVKILADTPSFNALNEFWRHSLHLAAANGHLPLVQYFVEDRRLDANMVCTDLSVDKGKPEVKNITPLFLALRGGHSEVALYLLKFTKTFDMMDSMGATLMHQAALSGCLEIMKTMAQQGINTLPRNNLGLTPFHFACGANQLAVVRAYVETELSNNATEAFDINMVGTSGVGALAYAAESGSKELVEYLLTRGADPHKANRVYGTTALHYAGGSGAVACLTLLLEKGVDVNCQDKKGLTALHFAASRGYKEAVKCLLDHNASIDTVSYDIGESALIMATRTLRHGVVNLAEA